MKFIELTKLDGTIIYVNASHIDTIVRDVDCTLVFINNSTVHTIVEAPLEILDQITVLEGR